MDRDYDIAIEERDQAIDEAIKLRTALAAANERAEKAEAQAAHWKEIGTNECVDREAEHAEFSDLLTSARTHAARWKALAVRLKAFERLREMALDAVATERDQLRAEVERLRDKYEGKCPSCGDVCEAGYPWAEDGGKRAWCVVCSPNDLKDEHELRADNDRLRKIAKEIDAGWAENSALRAALKRFGSHRVECNSNNSVNFAGKKGLPCDCGLDAALGEGGEG